MRKEVRSRVRSARFGRLDSGVLPSVSGDARTSGHIGASHDLALPELRMGLVHDGILINIGRRLSSGTRGAIFCPVDVFVCVLRMNVENEK